MTTIGSNKVSKQTESILAATPSLSVAELCLTTPLYSAVETQDAELLWALNYESFQFDAHCIHCTKESVFKVSRSYSSRFDRDLALSKGQAFVEAKCQRYTTHIYQFWFEFDGKILRKCGQRPSLEDIAGADIRRYEKLLDGGYFGELKRATGLASHGIGIGSFVYLRRIFEKLIADHRTQFEADGKTVDGFDTMRMDQKIGAIKTALPPALVENKAAYSILSKGIHELDEESCRKYFPVIRQAIILILEQDLQRKQRDDEAKKLRSEIARIAGEVENHN